MQNILVQGDNLKLLEYLNKKKVEVDLIYIDPPFATGKSFYHKQQKDKLLYSDKFTPEQLIQFLEPRLRLMDSILDSNGSIFVHCDYRTSHQIKLLLDEIFPIFRNEIIWRRMCGVKNSKTSNLPVITDSIFFYSKSKESILNQIFQPLSPERLKDYQRVDADGKRYSMGGRFSRRKRLLEVSQGVPLSNLWLDIYPVFANTPEYVGFTTQKPLKLMERIISLASSKDSLFADFFCGSGSSLIAAERLGRGWIGCDQSPLSITLTVKRLKSMILNRRFKCIKCP